jgi:hypothetical protein
VILRRLSDQLGDGLHQIVVDFRAAVLAARVQRTGFAV